MPDVKVKHRASVKDFTISVGGMLQCIGDLITPAVSNVKKESSLSFICPECNQKVHQQYHCEEHGHFLPGDCAKGRETEAGWVAVNQDMVKEAKSTELPPNVLTLHVHQAESVSIVPSGSGATYVFRPRLGDFYSVLMDLLERRPDLVWLGTANIRSNEKLFALQRGLNGQLLLIEVLWPQDVKDFDLPELNHNEQAFELATKVVETTLIEEFDPESYKPEARTRLETMLRTVAGVAASETLASAPKAAKAPDITEVLAGLLKQAGQE